MPVPRTLLQPKRTTHTTAAVDSFPRPSAAHPSRYFLSSEQVVSVLQPARSLQGFCKIAANLLCYALCKDFARRKTLSIGELASRIEDMAAPTFVWIWMCGP